MRTCTFSKVMATLRECAAGPYRKNQHILVEQMFRSYLDSDKSSGAFEVSTVSKWVVGTRSVSAHVVDYYSSSDATIVLQQDIRDYVVPALLDPDLAVTKLCKLIRLDTDMSIQKQGQLLHHALKSNDIAAFIADIVLYTINRPRLSADR